MHYDLKDLRHGHPIANSYTRHCIKQKYHDYKVHVYVQ